MSEDACPLCGGVCAGADLDSLLPPELDWLWRKVAATADRRGDPELTSGSDITLTLPIASVERAAVAGLVAGTQAGRRTRLGLANLTELVTKHSSTLTPGAVAAHCVGRPVGQRTVRQAARQARQDELLTGFHAACEGADELSDRSAELFEQLRRCGWIARLDATGEPESAASVLTRAVGVVRRIVAIPEGERFDRRLLVPSDPHALDDGSRLAGLSLALLAALGRTAAAPGIPARAQWAQIGVDCDDIIGGLPMLGIAPQGWHVPKDAVATIPPRELAGCRWAAPPAAGQGWVFVTENPSVLAAAASLAQTEPELPPLRLVCTMGTPSAMEISAIAAMSSAGWRVAVRADFDTAGIRHVNAVLAGVPDSVPWRMTSADYADSAPSLASEEPIPATHWDPGLASAMAEAGSVAFEEALIPQLLADLRAGRPHH